MRIAWEEPFGPVVPIMRVDSVEQAVEHCNKNRLALQGCVFTRDVNLAIRISDAMETGTVQVGGTVEHKTSGSYLPSRTNSCEGHSRENHFILEACVQNGSVAASQ